MPTAPTLLSYCARSLPAAGVLLDRAPLTGGHWVTINGHAVYILDNAGIIPARVKAGPGALKRFTRGNLEKAILEHHEAHGGGGGYDTRMAADLTNAVGGEHDAFVFHKRLPTEIKDMIGENPALRSVFRVSNSTREAKGADAYAALGHERYQTIAEARAGAPIRAAKEFAHQSGDPEAAFLAHVHDNLPKGGTRAMEAVKTAGLRVGDEFTIGGKAHRVAEDEHGFRVLRSHEYGKGDVPAEAASHVAIDKGSFRRAKGLRAGATAAHIPDDGIPFSRVIEAPILLSHAGVEILLSSAASVGTFGDPGFFREVNGQTVFLHGTPGHGFFDNQTLAHLHVKVHSKGGAKTINVEPGKGKSQSSWHPNADSAARDANSRVAHAETAAKATGEHVATLQRIPGKMPEGEGRYIVKPGGFNASGPTGHHIIDRISGEKSFVAGDRAAADAHVSKLEARALKAAPKLAADDPVAANRAAAEAKVAARKASAAPVMQSKAGQEATAEAPNPRVLTGYHGSPNKFDAFTVRPGDTESAYGPGVYFSPEKQGALDFVKNGAAEGAPHHLYTARVTLNKPYEADRPIPDEHFEAINAAAKDLGHEGIPEGFRGNNARNVYKLLTTRNGYSNATANKILAHAGFDGVRDSGQFTVFDPKSAKIQSVESFGGKAAESPVKPTAPVPIGHTIEETPAGHVVRSPEGEIVDGPTSKHKAERLAGELDDMRSGAILTGGTQPPPLQSHAGREAMSAPVDTSRQLGLFAKDKAGNAAEIGERPGQTDLPGLSIPKGAAATKPAAAPRDEPGQMRMPQGPALTSKAGRDALAGWKGTGAVSRDEPGRARGGANNAESPESIRAQAKTLTDRFEHADAIKYAGDRAADSERLSKLPGISDAERSRYESEARQGRAVAEHLRQNGPTAHTVRPITNGAGEVQGYSIHNPAGEFVDTAATEEAARAKAASYDAGTAKPPTMGAPTSGMTGRQRDAFAARRSFEKVARRMGERHGPNLSRMPEQTSHAGLEILLSAGPHKFSSTQFNLPPDVAEKVKAMAAHIPDEHLAEDGREEVPHATLLYGLHTNDAADVREALAGEGPVKFRLGKTSVFPASEGRNYDVVKLDVHTTGRDKIGNLHRLNKNLSDALPNTNTFPVYQPHVTLAYVKPGLGQQYAGMDDLHGRDVTCDHLTFSDRDDNETHIPLTGPTERKPAGSLLRKALERRGELMPPALSSHAGRALATA